MLHAMVHLEVKEPIMLHGEKFEKWREQLLIDDWEIGESHKHAEAENLKRHVWKVFPITFHFHSLHDSVRNVNMNSRDLPTINISYNDLWDYISTQHRKYV